MSMIPLETFLTNVEAIIASNPTYRTGGSGTDGTCDCIGLIIGAMVRAGHKKYDLHSSNYFARYQMQERLPISGPEDCYPGMVVYKRYAPGNANYNLNDRYKTGGRYYTGDPLDYYHVGGVLNASPLRIAHCTKYGTVDGIVVDTKIGKWECGGRLDGVDYNLQGYDGDGQMEEQATVWAASGSTVNLRKAPDEKGALIQRVPIGATVTVYEQAQGWAQVDYAGKRGYMMTAFLRFSGDSGTVEPGSGVVTREEFEALEARVSALELKG